MGLCRGVLQLAVCEDARACGSISVGWRMVLGMPKQCCCHSVPALWLDVLLQPFMLTLDVDCHLYHSFLSYTPSDHLEPLQAHNVVRLVGLATCCPQNML